MSRAKRRKRLACQTCQQPFFSHRAHAQFCSDACRKQAARNPDKIGAKNGPEAADGPPCPIPSKNDSRGLCPVFSEGDNSLKSPVAPKSAQPAPLAKRALEDARAIALLEKRQKDFFRPGRIEHRIEIFAPKRHNTHAMFYRGRHIGDSDCPIHSAARWLLANGHAGPDDVVSTFRGELRCSYARVGLAAEWTVTESDKHGLRLERYVAFPAALAAPVEGIAA